MRVCSFVSQLLQKCKWHRKQQAASYDPGQAAKAREKNKESKDRSVLRGHTETRMYNDDSGSHHSYVRISRLVFPVSPCVFAPSPCAVVLVPTRAVLKLRRRRHRRHFRVSILFLPLPPLIVWAVRGRVYVYALLYPVHGCQQILGPRRLALSRARHAMRLLGDSVQVQPH